MKTKKEGQLNNSEPLISIIILNYNAGELLLNCVESIQKSTYSNFEIILVDNISKDNSHLECKKRFKDNAEAAAAGIGSPVKFFL